MPPVPPEYLLQARRRMRRGLDPRLAEARERMLAAAQQRAAGGPPAVPPGQVGKRVNRGQAMRRARLEQLMGLRDAMREQRGGGVERARPLPMQQIAAGRVNTQQNNPRAGQSYDVFRRGNQRYHRYADGQYVGVPNPRPRRPAVPPGLVGRTLPPGIRRRPDFPGGGFPESRGRNIDDLIRQILANGGFRRRRRLA